MTDSLPSKVTPQMHFADLYRQSSVLNQQIVQLFAVIYGPVSRSSAVDCFNRAGLRTKTQKPFLAATAKTYIDDLLATGLLIQDRGKGPQCNPLVAEIATRDAVRLGLFEKWVAAVEACLPIRSSWRDGPRRFNNENEFMREVRIGLYRKDMKFVEKQFEDYARFSYHTDKITLDDVYWRVCNNPFDPDWFATLPLNVASNALKSILDRGVSCLEPTDEALKYLQEVCTQPKHAAQSDDLQVLLTEQLILRGRIEKAQQSLVQCSDQTLSVPLALSGWLAFLHGDCEVAIAHYATALKLLRQGTGKRTSYFSSIHGILFILTLIKAGSATQLREAGDYLVLVAKQPNYPFPRIYAFLANVVKVQQGQLAAKEAVINASIPHHDAGNSFETLFCALCLYWVSRDTAMARLPKLLEAYYRQAEKSGYRWLAMEAAELLSRIKARTSFGTQAEVFRQVNNNIATLVDTIQFQEAWELCLNALTNLQKDPPAEATPEAALRLVWFVTLQGYACQLTPREQKITAKGDWSRGRTISLKRLHENLASFDYFTSQDRRVCQQIQSYYSEYRYYGQVEYVFSEKAIMALVGHPLVFWEDSPTTRVEVIKGEPELLVQTSKPDWLTLQFSPPIVGENEVLVIKETPTRLKVIEITHDHRRIAEILGVHNCLEVPAAAKERVLTAINAVSGVVTVHSDIGGGDENAQVVSADATPHVHLLPAGPGLKVAVMVRPFTQGGPYFRPGTGGKTVIAEIEGERFQTTRDLNGEKQQANVVIASCPVLDLYPETDGEWLVENPEHCLELLLDLQTLEGQVVIEWPEGETLRVAHQAGINNFRININRQKDWFAASGELELADNLVLDMQRLLELLDRTPSRFVPLGDGQFLALTQEFRKRLDELRAFSEVHGKEARFHPLAALALEEFVDEVGHVNADKHWKAHLQRLQEMKTFQSEVPSTLQAELRDYQVDGFRWLARLAHWGVGACLADDMGLGKTLQALAAILTRAAEGPTLIVAPTSVGMNWFNEAQRFAPTLNAIQFGSGDRQKLLDSLQPFDMLVCSYGLLQQEDVAEMLAKVEWQTIVLDEAQAIKNFATKRSKAAMSLQGGFKLITTGTPIENHLGELWNLFRFINPGLLGSLDQFNLRFANPIERDQNKQARQKLKKLIQPFLLRRTKNQVLQELPERTEITLHVELSKEEMAFYEALRRDAIAKLADSDAEAGAKHLQVLAEIMKLRRACCNPSLVVPDAPIPSGKLQLFGEVLSELLDNHHKALVFSQFVDHLRILRDYLERQKISYQYLDGSTPAKERKKRVDAFQAGEGNVFLISLKAGGTGLNLTAADYVIHMDPWWNPAVEDQASDRAHRIGQQRPVTIYRLVAKDTIEEKIVDLHQQKRDLADSLLEGTDMSGKISTDELLRLIQEQ